MELRISFAKILLSVVRKNEDESVVETIDISQNEQGVDTEDRIIKLKGYIASHFGK